MRLRLRDCVLDTGVREVTRHGAPVKLSPKAFRLLEVLAGERPNAIAHADLRERLWPEAVAGGTSLARLVSELRTALGDDGGDPIVRTVHRFGYALASAEVERTALAEVERTALAGVERTAPGRAGVGCALRWGSQLVPLALGDNVIGRAADALITLPASKVSRRHARIVVSERGVFLEDLASRNGTYVQDRRITGRVELKNGDRIGVGPAQLVFCAGSDDALTSADSGQAPPESFSR